MIKNPTKIKLTPIIGLDLETTGLAPYEDKISVIAIGTENGDKYVWDCAKYSQKYLKTLMEGVAACKAVVIHNAKFDVSFIYNTFGVVLNNVFDTMLASQILRNGLNANHDLASVISYYLGKKHDVSEDKKRLQKSFVGLKYGTTITDEQLEYAVADISDLIPLYKHLTNSLKHEKLDKIMRLENKLVPVLAKMEVRGCLIDKTSWLQEINKWDLILNDIKAKLDDIVYNLLQQNNITSGAVIEGKIFYAIDLFGNIGINYGSQAQVLKLFKVLDEPTPTDKYNNEAVNEDAIKAYINEMPDTPMKEFLDVLLEYREYYKLISTYGEKFLSKLDKNNYIHTSYTQCFTATGRLSSKSPNLQNIPNVQSGGAGAVVRDYFIAPQGYKMITSDMSSAEVRIAADLSGEQFLLDSLYKGLDMHSVLASKSFSIIYGGDVQVSKSTEPIYIKGHRLIPADLRQDHKTVLFAKFYKAGAKRVYQCLAKHINLVHEPENRLDIASQISKAIDEEMPVLTSFLENLINKAQINKFLIGSKLGRRRYFDESVYGDAANFPIQCINAEAMKVALIKIDEYFEEKGTGWPVLTVHDEVVCVVKEEYAEQAAEKVKEIMADSLQWFLNTVDGGASVKIKHCWEK